MTLLLDQCGDKFIITESVLAAAAGNERAGKKVMQLLFDRRSESATALVTDDTAICAATCGQDEVLNLLSKRSLIPIRREWRCIAILYNFSKAGNSKRIEELIHAGTKPDMKNNRGETPLWVAARYGNKAVVRVLAHRIDVDVNSTSNNGESALFWPSYEGNEQIVRLLLQAGADPQIIDANGDTPITLARRGGHEQVARILEHSGRQQE